MIIGVDCGKDKVHMVREDGYCRSFKVASDTPRDIALRNLAVNIRRYFTQEGIYRKDTRLYVEEAVLAGRMNIRSTIRIAETVGMVLSLGYPATLVPVSTWKKAVVGSGNASKEEVRWWALGHDRWNGVSDEQDFYDAAAICAYGVQDMEVAQRVRGGLLTSQGGAQVP